MRFAAAAIAVCVTFGAGPVSAQTVDDLVAKYYAARGGYEKLKAVQTVKITQTVGTPFSTTKVVIQRKRPGLVRWDQTPAGQPAAIPRAINAEGGWDTVGGKVVPRPDSILKQDREFDADIDGLLVDWKDKGHTVALDGTEKVRGRATHRLKITTKGGNERLLWLDAETFLPVKEAGKIALPPGPGGQQRFSDRTFIFSDWRDVNGVKFPFAIDEMRIEGPITQEFATYVEKVEVNVPIEDAIFAMPKPAGRP